MASFRSHYSTPHHTCLVFILSLNCFKADISYKFPIGNFYSAKDYWTNHWNGKAITRSIMIMSLIPKLWRTFREKREESGKGPMNMRPSGICTTRSSVNRGGRRWISWRRQLEDMWIRLLMNIEWIMTAFIHFSLLCRKKLILMSVFIFLIIIAFQSMLKRIMSIDKSSKMKWGSVRRTRILVCLLNHHKMVCLMLKYHHLKIFSLSWDQRIWLATINLIQRKRPKP